MSGYRVILDSGINGRDVEFPDADCYTVKDGTYLKVGKGKAQFGSMKGEKLGTFNWDNVCGIVDM